MRRGEVVWRDGKLSVEPGTGRFVPLEPFGPLFEGLGRRAQHAQQAWDRYWDAEDARAAAAVGDKPGLCLQEVVTA